MKLNEQYYIMVYTRGLELVNGKRIDNDYAITKTSYGAYNVTHISTGCGIKIGGYARLKDCVAEADKQIEIAKKYLKDNPDLFAKAEVEYDYCIHHDLLCRPRWGGKMKRVNPEVIIDRLIVTRINFVKHLYDSLCMYEDDLDALYKDKYIRKWISIEDALRSHGIDISPKDYPKGLAINIGLIRDYLTQYFERNGTNDK